MTLIFSSYLHCSLLALYLFTTTSCSLFDNCHAKFLFLNLTHPALLLFTVSGRTSAKASGRKGSVGNTQSSPSMTKSQVSSPTLSRSAPGSFMLTVQPLHSLSLSLIQNHAISSSYSSRGSRSQGTHEHAVYPTPAPALSKVRDTFNVAS